MRVLHTIVNEASFTVGDLERSIRFYTEVLGMRLLRRHDYPDGKFTNVRRLWPGDGAGRDRSHL